MGAEATITAESEHPLREEIARWNARYREQPRKDADEVLHAKVRHSHWRSAMVRRLLAAAEAGTLDASSLREALVALAVRLDDAQLVRLRGVLDSAGVDEVLAQQGVRGGDAALHALAGPDLDLRIEVNRDSSWPFERWRENPEFARYAFEGDAVRYRGLLLQPGDLILPNVNLDGNFVYSSLSAPKGFCPHSAVFVVLEHDGTRFPAVIETYEKGLRAVPLCVFLNARYISYGEVYRHRNIGRCDAAHVTRTAHAALDHARGYNFHTVAEDRAYICCTSVARQLYVDLGLEFFDTYGAIVDPGIRERMQQLDYHWLDEFFTPIDFILSDEFEYVGHVDNQQPARLVARELVEARFRHCFSTGNIDWARVPLLVRLMHWGILHIRDWTLIGRLISVFAPFDNVSLPKGPERILAIVEPLEAELGKAVRRLQPEIEARIDALDALELEDLLEDEALAARVAELLPMRWLNPA